MIFAPDSTIYGGVVGFDDPALNALLAQGAITTDFEERKRIYHAYEERLLELSPVIWYMSRESGWAQWKKVKGFEMPLPGTTLWSLTIALDYTWLDD